MIRLRRLFFQLANLFRHHRAEAELAREVNAHLALLADDLEQRGLSAEQARLAARRAYGGVEQAKQAHRDERSLVVLEHALQDLRHAARALLHNPGFTLVAAATIALGVGVNTTLFTAYNAVALKQLPVADAASVMRLRRTLASGSIGEIQYAFSFPEYLSLRDHQNVFQSVVAASWPVRVLVAPASSAAESLRPAQAQLVSGNYFAALGITAATGRVFAPGEDQIPGGNPVLVLSHAFWQRRYRADPQVLGSIVRIGTTPFTVIGIAPPEFTGTSINPQVPDFWVPLSMQAQLVPGQDWLHKPDDFQFQFLSRLRPDLSVKQAEAQTDSLVRRFASTYLSHDRTLSVVLERTSFFGNTNDPRFRAGVGAVMVLFALVLLVACANVTNMLVARGAARQKEISVRLALGAGRARVIRHLLTESMLLALAGGVAGLALAILAARLLWIALNQILVHQLGSDFVLSLNLNPDARVLTYALALSLATGLIFGLSPALQFTRPDLNTSLKDESTSFGRGVDRSRLRGLLICGQVAVSMLLLSSAGLLLRGLARSQSADPGFPTQHLYLLRADFGDDPAKATAAFHHLAEWLQTVPEVASVSYGTAPMMGTWTPHIFLKHPGALQGIIDARTLAGYASDTYLNTLGIDLLLGRNLTLRESSTGAPLAIISASTARLFWPGESALGKHFQLDLRFDGKRTDYEVIGIVRDVRFANLTRIDPARVYLAADPAQLYPIFLNLRGDPATALAGLWGGLRSYDRNLLASISLWNVDSMLLAPQRTLARALASLAAILALLALSLAGIGIYGVMAYVVSQRTQEIGVRIALGATPGRILHNIAVEGLRPVLFGAALGLAGGAGLSLLLHHTLAFPGSIDFLYGVSFYDPLTFLGILVFLTVVSLTASLGPALKAIRVDPVTALRYE
ncbi:FtsX-like permease family protein [Acidobacteria bacterium AB60]|nr:FtsX-like permease family protein [Acidobacteria bacterium AB60]